MGERWREWREEGSAYLSGCMREWRGGGCLQLTGNLFLLFSLNKGCDWLHCVRTDLLHAGNKALKKRLIHSKVTTTAGCHNAFNGLDRQEKSVLYYGSHSVACK